MESRPRASSEELDVTPQQEQRPSHWGDTGDDYFNDTGGDEDDGDVNSPSRSWRRASLSIRIPPPVQAADVAFTALQYLPMPLLVLSSAKTIVLANEAMGRLLGIDVNLGYEDGVADGVPFDQVETRQVRSATDILYGVTLTQLGMDLIQGANPVFVAWDDFLETLVDDASRAQPSTTLLNTHHNRGVEKETTPTDKTHKRTISQASNANFLNGSKAEVHDSITEVVFSTHRDSKTGLPLTSRHDMTGHVQAQMIVSVWATEDDQYFTLTFTASGSSSTSSDGSTTTSRTVSKATTSHTSLGSGLSSGTSSSSSGYRRSMQPTSAPKVATSAASPALSPEMDLLPKGPPGKTSSAAAPTMFNKSNRLKDAILNSMSLPAYAMWKDESFGLPNKAAIKLIYPWIENGAYDTNEQARDFLSKFVFYNEDFSAQIPMEDFPILRVMREQKAFEGYRIGMYSPKDGTRLLYDAAGEPILDDKGEFLGGLVIFQDVTTFATTINRQQKENETQFEHICNMVPQLIWRARPTGYVDYFSDRWYTFTGLSYEDSAGDGWVSIVHPDDIAVAGKRWEHSLTGGDEYLTEYRCRNANGEWRWMLGRAVPMRDHTGAISAWFGTCTDIHDLVQSREEAKQTRAQLERVVEHARITLWAVDKDRRLTLFEGRPMWRRPQSDEAQAVATRAKYLGMKFEDIFKEQGRTKELDIYCPAIDNILAGKSEDETIEVKIESVGKWFKTRLYPLLRQDRKGGLDGGEFLDGVVGVSMDITALKEAADEVERRNEENSRLMAQSVAAKEASKMKSQFLANMSHEIRTPIAGVIGMAELLLDDDTGELTNEQRESAENIQRSANGLLTVINDILDFSKVESGRLDIEEVQFDLSVVIRDVNKMLSFAAERKGLKYIDDIEELKSWKVIGDPGRLRQVMTNLLTNSIKFTSEGSVTLRVKVHKETPDILEVHFTVEDTGIGIEEEVRQRLFTPFSQADSSTARRFGGTGLGLTISKNLVELMRGKINLESKLGQGTTAKFWIPFHKAPYQTADSPVVDIGSIPDRLQSDLSVSRASSDAGAPATPTMPGRPVHSRGPSNGTNTAFGHSEGHSQEQLADVDRSKVNILVVEDNAVNQQIALKTIKKLGFPVQAVWNGKEALEHLQRPSKEQPRPDIILMDVQMPVLDGYRATYTIRNSKLFMKDPVVQNTPIVAMTASAIQGDREKCEMAGMDDYLAKPVKKPTLEKMLLKWAIEGQRKRADVAKNSLKPKRPSGSRNPSSFTAASDTSSMQSPQDRLSSELDRLEFAHRAAFERSSESTDVLALRHQQAEEKAISLRDDALMESGEDPKSKLGRGVNEEGHYHEAEGQSSDALTTENMQRFAQNDRMSSLKREESGLEGDNSSIDAKFGESQDAQSLGPISRVSTSNSPPAGFRKPG